MDQDFNGFVIGAGDPQIECHVAKRRTDLLAFDEIA